MIRITTLERDARRSAARAALPFEGGAGIIPCMSPSDQTEASLLRDAGQRARALLDALVRDQLSLGSDPAWQSGVALHARAAEAARRLLAELDDETDLTTAAPAPRPEVPQP